jgi:hypothetical protein
MRTLATIIISLSLYAPLLNSQDAKTFFHALNGATGQFSFVQQTSQTSSSTTSPITLTLNGTVAGNLITVTFGGRTSASGTFTVSDNVNGSYTNSGTCHNASSLTNYISIFYFISGAGGNLTITASVGNVTRIYAVATEYKSTTAVTFDQTSCSTQSSTSSPTSNSVTVTGSNNLLVGGMMDFNASSSGCGASWTNCNKNTDQANVIVDREDQLNQPTGSYSSAFTLGTSQNDWECTIATFKD